MAPDLIPIIVPAIDWSLFIRESSGALGYSPARIVDSNRSPLTPFAQFVASLSSMHGYTNAITALRESRYAREHLFFSFLAFTDSETVFQLMERTPLAVISSPAVDGERVAQLSGNVEQWRLATIACCVPTATFNLRLLFDKAVLFFEKFGLSEVWHDQRKKSLPDQTFLLEAK